MLTPPCWRADVAPVTPPGNTWLRLVAGGWRQTQRSRVCDEGQQLAGQRVLITGSNAGIGLATSRGLLQRGAEVFMACRSERKAALALAALRDELGTESSISSLPLDLSDLARVRDCSDRLAKELGDRRIDVVVCNAGLWPTRYSTSKQGHEIAFATNVLGHHALLRQLMRGTLAERARIIVLTGDIYALVDDCSPDYRYRTAVGGMLAYCRSKLGNLWHADQLRRRFPSLSVAVVHPGIVASNLGGGGGPLSRRVRRRAMIDPDRGAQATLFAATSADLPPDAYLHNTLGLVALADADPARNTARAEQLWDTCERLVEGYVE